jgi:hypothetical protein
MVRRLLLIALAAAALYLTFVWSFQDHPDVRRTMEERIVDEEGAENADRPKEDAVTKAVRKRQADERVVKQSENEKSPEE